MTTALVPPPPPPPVRPVPTRLGDWLFRGLCRLAAGSVVAVTALLFVVLILQAWPARSRFVELLTSSDWNPNAGKYGALTFIVGTLVTSAIAMLLAVPLGVGAAAYLSEIAPRFVRRVCGFLLEILAAIPSVVYGFWAKLFLAPFVLSILKTLEVPGLQEGHGGEGILAAGLVLAIMVLPYITAVSFDVCQAVPRSLREGALALGSTRWQMIWKVVLPSARPGIVAGSVLGLGRAIGETMAVTMVIGNADSLNFSLAATGDTIPSVIAKGLHEAFGEKRAVLIALGLLLLILTTGLNASAKLLLAWAARPRLRTRGAVSVREGLPPPEPPSPERIARSRKWSYIVDKFMTVVLAGCQVMTVIPLLLILGFITYRGAAEVNWEFFTNLPPDIEPPGGLGHAVLGSLMLVGLATLCAVPVGILTAVFLSEFRTSRFAGTVRFVAELLGGVPSIVIGIFGYAMLVDPFWYPGRSWGPSGWAGAFALGVMMLPVVIRSSEESLKLVPAGLREASYALGAARWQTVLRVLVPAALPAILTGVLLAVGRIAGETAPLILTARGSNFWPHSPGEPTPYLTYFVYEYSKNTADPDQQRLGWAAAFVLLVAVLAVNVLTRLLAGKRSVDASRAG